MIRYPFPKRDERIRTRHAAWVAEKLAGLPLDRDWVCEIKADTKSRTGRQNRYMHAIIGQVARHVGMDPEAMKEALVMRFLGAAEERIVGGIVITERVSTAKLDTSRCARFCDDIRSWAAQFLGLLLPTPEEWCE